MVGMGAFWGTRVMEIVKKNDGAGLLWKRIKLTSTRKANAKKRLRRVWQNEAVLRACAEPPAQVSSTKTAPTEIMKVSCKSKNDGDLRHLNTKLTIYYTLFLYMVIIQSGDRMPLHRLVVGLSSHFVLTSKQGSCIRYSLVSRFFHLSCRFTHTS